MDIQEKKQEDGGNLKGSFIISTRRQNKGDKVKECEICRTHGTHEGDEIYKMLPGIGQLEGKIPHERGQY